MIKQFPFRFNKPINNTNREKLTIPYNRTSVGKNSLLYQEYKTWNLEIPANTENKESYKNSAKNYHITSIYKTGYKQHKVLTNIKLSVFFIFYICLIPVLVPFIVTSIHSL